jgi:Asp-tRNA(Asn)/Glu-tRNA(Gln) amidotransferase A subunit family amidase
VALGCRALEAAGVELRPCDLPAWAGAGFDAHAVVQGHEAWRCLGWEFDTHADLLSPVLRDYLQGAQAIQPADYADAQHLCSDVRRQSQAWLGGFDALLMPSAPDEAPLGLASTGDSSFNRLWTLLGVPCVSVPGAVGDHGAPVGLQLVAPRGADAQVLGVALRLEQALATWATARAP